MRNTLLAYITLAALTGMCGALVLAQGGAATTVIEQAPKDRAIAMPKEKWTQYLKDMDARKLSTLRIVEGGKHNVNIRRITTVETAGVQPNTIEVWYVMEGSGTLTTGGKIENGKIVGGESDPIKPGDVEFIPAGLPRGVSGVDGSVTWLNIRWDVDWPADAPMGAGTAPPVPGAAPRGGRGGVSVMEYAPTDRAVHFSKETLVAFQKDMDAKKTATLRMIEGGHFNVNIRRINAPSGEFHATTIDTWVVLEGSGTVNTGYTTSNGNPSGPRVSGTGVDAPAKVEDVFFIPSSFTHGFGAVNGVMSWLNIRWDDNYGKK